MNFEIRLLKGKIAEDIVECMFKEAKIEIIRTGYEHNFEHLLNRFNVKGKSIEELRRLPDFMFIQDNRSYFLEVKFRKDMFNFDIKKLKSKYSDFVIVVYPEGISIISLPLADEKKELNIFPLSLYDDMININLEIIDKYEGMVKRIYKNL